MNNLTETAGSLDLFKLITDFGVMVALVVFFVWESAKRENRLASRIDALETQLNDEMRVTHTETKAVLIHATRAIEDNTAVLRKIESKIHE